jgi:hypothetical protein
MCEIHRPLFGFERLDAVVAVASESVAVLDI